MTKNELKQKYTEWNKQITALDQKQKRFSRSCRTYARKRETGTAGAVWKNWWKRW